LLREATRALKIAAGILARLRAISLPDVTTRITLPIRDGDARLGFSRAAVTFWKASGGRSSDSSSANASAAAFNWSRMNAAHSITFGQVRSGRNPHATCRGITPES